MGGKLCLLSTFSVSFELGRIRFELCEILLEVEELLGNLYFQNFLEEALHFFSEGTLLSGFDFLHRNFIEIIVVDILDLVGTVNLHLVETVLRKAQLALCLEVHLQIKLVQEVLLALANVDFSLNIILKYLSLGEPHLGASDYHITVF